MLICKWLKPPDDHLQEAGWSSASGWSLQMIICRWPDPPDDHLQVAGPSSWSFASGRSLQMIIWKWPDPGSPGVTGQKEEKKEKEKEEKKFLQTGREGPTEGSTRGPRESKNRLFFGSSERSFQTRIVKCLENALSTSNFLYFRSVTNVCLSGSLRHDLHCFRLCRHFCTDMST